MNITIRTKVNTNYKSVFSRFDLSLFKALKPFGIPLKVERFDGCKVGDEIHLIVGPFKQTWVSIVTENIIDGNESSFVDEGDTVPFPISKWRHYHKIERISESETYIVDDINYECRNIILTYLMYPLFYLQFLSRVPVYKRFFDNGN